MLTADKIALLSSTDVQDYIRKNLKEDAHKLALKKSPFGGIESRDLSNQLAALQKAKVKLPSWSKGEGVVFPEMLSMEQCSSESTANYKQRFIPQNSRVADITGGFGVDSYALSGKASSLDYIEQQSYLCDLARSNFQQLGASNIKIHHLALENYLKDWEKHPSDIVFCDPARRNENQRKVFLLEDCSPNLKDVAEIVLRQGKILLAKLSPLFDIHQLRQDFGQHLREVHVVAVKNECKELLILIKPEKGNCLITAVNLETEEEEFTIDANVKSSKPNLSEPLTYLYEPNAAIMKSGRQDELSKSLSLLKLADNSHLYTANNLFSFPGRIFLIKSVFPLDKKVLTGAIPGKKANITCRNFPLRPEELARKIGFTFGGDQFLVATTLFNEKKIILHCEKPSSI